MNAPDIWFFDQNHRVYSKHVEPGDIWPKGGPIWREHWRKLAVIGETRVSWLINPAWCVGSTIRRIPKNATAWKLRRYFAFSLQEIDDRAFIDTHARLIAAAVSSIDDVTLLRLVAALIGYNEYAKEQP